MAEETIPIPLTAAAKPTNADLAARYGLGPTSNAGDEALTAIREMVLATARKLVKLTPACREQERALESLDETWHCAQDAIARHS